MIHEGQNRYTLIRFILVTLKRDLEWTKNQTISSGAVSKNCPYRGNINFESVKQY